VNKNFKLSHRSTYCETIALKRAAKRRRPLRDRFGSLKTQGEILAESVQTCISDDKLSIRKVLSAEICNLES
jgi:hypothetical protein